jgi:hypothetical protein
MVTNTDRQWFIILEEEYVGTKLPFICVGISSEFNREETPEVIVTNSH